MKYSEASSQAMVVFVDSRAAFRVYSRICRFGSFLNHFLMTTVKIELCLINLWIGGCTHLKKTLSPADLDIFYFSTLK